MTSAVDTIFALSSGSPPSAIAIVRISGPNAAEGLEALVGSKPTPRMAARRRLTAPGGAEVDDALVLWFPGPASATGEDVVELHVHGSRAVLQALFAALGAMKGLRPAEPGEFTRRAFENGKIDLTQAEALDDLIHADTEAQRRQALRQLDGLLGEQAREWRQAIIDASALIEAGIDFSDELDVPDDPLAPATDVIRRLSCEISCVLQRGSTQRLRTGLVVAITGAPNVGKSSLMNQLAHREIAIVSPYPGTTRDVLEVACDFGGYPVTLIDTAGLREANDPVEQEGIRRARARAASADLQIWLIDEDTAELPGDNLSEIWPIRNKSDLELTTGSNRRAVKFSISALTGSGLDRLIEAITCFARDRLSGEDALIFRERHHWLLREAVDALDRALLQKSDELIAEELRRATLLLGRLLGRVDVEDVLGSIFANFCIGK